MPGEIGGKKWCSFIAVYLVTPGLEGAVLIPHSRHRSEDLCNSPPLASHIDQLPARNALVGQLIERLH
jgi:hypothetical protein